jgi:hypothetical protein
MDSTMIILICILIIGIILIILIFLFANSKSNFIDNIYYIVNFPIPYNSWKGTIILHGANLFYEVIVENPGESTFKGELYQGPNINENTLIYPISFTQEDSNFIGRGMITLTQNQLLNFNPENFYVIIDLQGKQIKGNIIKKL